jgi:cytidylate kinase
MSPVRTGNSVVAVDGPSGSGKSTVSRGVAEALGLPVLDTGAMYRAVTLVALDRGIDPADADAAADVARQVRIDLDEGRVFLDGRDVTAEIRGPAVTDAVSIVSAHPGVRKVLVERQRQWVEHHGGGVVEGRDIGTVVFPNATVKVFLTASEDERARRRQRDEHAAERNVDVDEVRDALDRRDRLDSTRAASPLRRAEDAIVIDTTGRDPHGVVEEIVKRYEAVRARS